MQLYSIKRIKGVLFSIKRIKGGYKRITSLINQKKKRITTLISCSIKSKGENEKKVNTKIPLMLSNFQAIVSQIQMTVPAVSTLFN